MENFNEIIDELESLIEEHNYYGIKILLKDSYTI